MKLSDIGPMINAAGEVAKVWGGAVSIAGILGAALIYFGFGFDVKTPWSAISARAAAAELKVADMGTRLDTQQQQIQTQQTQINTVLETLKEESCDTKRLMRDRYAKDLDEAQTELNKNPTSPILLRARDTAKTNIANMDARLSAPPCV